MKNLGLVSLIFSIFSVTGCEAMRDPAFASSLAQAMGQANQNLQMQEQQRQQRNDDRFFQMQMQQNQLQHDNMMIDRVIRGY